MQANKHCHDAHFSVGDQVLINTHNLKFSGCKKFEVDSVRSFSVAKLVSPVARKLDLGTQLKGVHNVFHI